MLGSEYTIFLAMLATRLKGWQCRLVGPPLWFTLQYLNHKMDCHDIFYRFSWVHDFGDSLFPNLWLGRVKFPLILLSLRHFAVVHGGAFCALMGHKTSCWSWQTRWEKVKIFHAIFLVKSWGTSEAPLDWDFHYDRLHRIKQATVSLLHTNLCSWWPVSVGLDHYGADMMYSDASVRLGKAIKADVDCRQ